MTVLTPINFLFIYFFYLLRVVTILSVDYLIGDIENQSLFQELHLLTSFALPAEASSEPYQIKIYQILIHRD